MSVQIIRGNALELPLADDSVDLIVTSPPYFGLRSYQDTCAACRELERTGEDPRQAFPDWAEHARKFHHYDGQIGAEATPAEFVDALIAATREMIRVTKPTGSIWVNLGDKYAGGGGQWDKDERPDPGRRRAVSGKIATGGKSWGMKPKTLVGIPWRYAIRCIDDLGLILRAEVIWSKPNGLPESVTDRVRRSHEQWFHFTLNPRYYSAVDEIREESGPEKACGPGAMRGPRSIRERGQADPTLNNPLGKLPGSVWTVATEPLRVPDELGIDHFAAFPTEWPRRIVQGWSPRGVCVECGEGRRPVISSVRCVDGIPHEDLGARKVGGYQTEPSGIGNWRVTTERARVGDACDCPEPTAPTTPGTVLDPFGGTGTTALVADVLGRNGISVDMSADYCRLAEWRTTDPKQRAKAARREHRPAAEQIDGQSSLLDLIEEPA